MKKALFVLLSILLLPACSSLGYYLDLANGHADILNRARPIDTVLQDPQLAPAVRTALEQVVAAREFAREELLLPDNGSYREYADIERPFVVWNVIAAPRWSVQPRKWCFAVVGCISYRGFFDEAEARAHAEQLRRQGNDVYVAGVRAYSTLGWFDDPVLNTMLYRDELQQVSLIFHELAHQKIYVKNDTEYNESFATAVAEEGVRRWLQHHGRAGQFRLYQQRKRYRQAFNALLRQTRENLATLYASESDELALARQKAAIFTRLRHDYQQLRARWNDNPRYDNWMAQDLNNAHLALIATYHDLVPVFRRLLAQSNGDLQAFYARAEALAKLDADARRHRLLALAEASP